MTASDRWRDLGRHWHCHRVEQNINEQVSEAEIQGTPAEVRFTPEEVLDWMEAEVKALLPRADQAWRSNAQRLVDTADLQAAHLLVLQAGKATGQGVRFSEQRMLSLHAIPAGPNDVRSQQVLGAVICNQHGSPRHEGSATR
jgi:hypothetical protein